MNAYRRAVIEIDDAKTFQTISGFGVNLNTKYWEDGLLRPVLDLLIDDLGASLFRIDIFGKADWFDPQHKADPACVLPASLQRAYETQAYRDGVGCAKYLNSRGILPYVTVSGVTSPLLCGEDGVTLEKYALYADILADFAARLRADGVRFGLFGPINETDYAAPEGPAVPFSRYEALYTEVIRAFDERGLCDVRFTLAEQGDPVHDPILPVLQNARIRRRIAVTTSHVYYPFDGTHWVAASKALSPEALCWATEFGTLDQGDGNEQALGFECGQRLMHLVRDGVEGAMVWDAFDNFHDHDNAWTTYGILKNSRHVFVPKPRYYFLKQCYRYIAPGAVRIGAVSTEKAVETLGFRNPDGTLTVVCLNPTCEPVTLSLNLRYYKKGEALAYLPYRIYCTGEGYPCADVTTPAIYLEPAAGKGLETVAPPHSIVTMTNRNR